MQEPDSDEIYNLLKRTSQRYGGRLPELYRIAWDAYLNSGVMDHVDYDYEKFWDFFPNFDTDPDCNDPVLAMSIGKHYFDNYYGVVPEGECIEETEFQALHRKITQDTKHLGGELTPGFTVAWGGKLLGLRDCGEITDEEYKQLKALLPELKDDPVKEVEAFTRKYLEANRHQEVPPA